MRRRVLTNDRHLRRAQREGGRTLPIDRIQNGKWSLAVVHVISAECTMNVQAFRDVHSKSYIVVKVILKIKRGVLDDNAF